MFKFIISKFRNSSSSNSGGMEKRRFFRLPIMENIDIKVRVRILPYFRSEEIEGILVNLSAGGIGLRLSRLIPKRNFLFLQIAIPHSICISCHAEVKHIVKTPNALYQHGIEFLDLAQELQNHILKMSKEYLECGGKIKYFKKTECAPQCSAYGICTRKEKVLIP